MLYYKLYLSTQNACELELSANQKVVDALLPLQGALKQWQLQPRKKKKEFFFFLFYSIIPSICLSYYLDKYFASVFKKITYLFYVL